MNDEFAVINWSGLSAVRSREQVSTDPDKQVGIK